MQKNLKKAFKVIIFRILCFHLIDTMVLRFILFIAVVFIDKYIVNSTQISTANICVTVFFVTFLN